MWDTFLINDWCERVQPTVGDAVPRQVVLGYRKKVTEILVKWEHGGPWQKVEVGRER